MTKIIVFNNVALNGDKVGFGAIRGEADAEHEEVNTAAEARIAGVGSPSISGVPCEKSIHSVGQLCGAPILVVEHSTEEVAPLNQATPRSASPQWYWTALVDALLGSSTIVVVEIDGVTTVVMDWSCGRMLNPASYPYRDTEQRSQRPPRARDQDGDSA